MRPRTAFEEQGRAIYIQNGCTYCHTQFVREIDWDLGAEPVVRAGDYVRERPHLLGTERTGPDLSQEGGEPPDDWHLAHFINLRFVRPESVMPSWEFLGTDNIRALIACKQSLCCPRCTHERRFPITSLALHQSVEEALNKLAGDHFAQEKG